MVFFSTFYPCDKQGYCNRVQYFFSLNNLEMVNLGLVHNKFKCLCVSGALGLVVTNTPGTVKVLGSNLTGPVFFFQSVNKLSSYFLSAYILSA